MTDRRMVPLLAGYVLIAVLLLAALLYISGCQRKPETQLEHGEWLFAKYIATEKQKPRTFMVHHGYAALGDVLSAGHFEKSAKGCVFVLNRGSTRFEGMRIRARTPVHAKWCREQEVQRRDGIVFLE